jgi:3-phenylpropionate/trans-cinnamate dioxygenase ferredoxin reductase subunit
MAEDVMLERAFGSAVGAWFEVRLQRRGVRVCAGTSIESIMRTDDGLHVRLADGRELGVDRVVVGAGVIPSTEPAADAGLDLALGGIAVDASLRASEPDIHAIGDVAAYESELHGRRVRIEHWDVARAQGVHVAEQIIRSGAEPFRVLPYFFGTMGDWAYLEYTGLGGGRAVFRGSADDDDMSAAFIDDDDVLTGLITVGRPDDLEAARELVLERARVRPDALADARVPLRGCLHEAPLVTG